MTIPHFSLLHLSKKHAPFSFVATAFFLFRRKELHQKLSQHDLLLEQLGEKQRSLQVEIFVFFCAKTTGRKETHRFGEFQFVGVNDDDF